MNFTKAISAAVSAAIAAASFTTIPITASADDVRAEITYNYDGSDHTRLMEKLDRGLKAVKVTNGVFLSWRLLGTESSVADIASAPGFYVYKNGEQIAEVTDSTNYLDTSGSANDTYSVAPMTDGAEQCAEVSVMSENYFDIALEKPAAFSYTSGDTTVSYDYTAGDASCGDLDGDGEYEIVLKWDCNPQDNSNGGITGNVLLDAYKLDGTKLWRIDLGRNIRSGAHYTQFLVYDFDGDGKAEVTCKTAPGSLDGAGNYVTAASSDSDITGADNTVSYVNDSGYILEGPEYFTAFDGATGAALDTIAYPNARVSADVWGDTWGNRCDRFVADVAYLDGENPYAVYERGYYWGKNGSQRASMFAIRMENGKFTNPLCFDTLSTQPGYTSGNEQYVGEGNHNMTAADVDDDGCDEVITGALCMELDDNGALNPKWCTYLGHGDALHIGDYDPTHTGLEFFTVHEEGGGVSTYGNVSKDYGFTVISPDTGETLFHSAGTDDTGRGLMANVGAGGYYQIYTSKTPYYAAMGNDTFTEISTAIGSNFRIFWDADLYDEALDGTSVSSWTGSAMSVIFNAGNYDCTSINGTKANPSLQADLFGDWREEIVCPTSDSTALRVFMSTDVTTYKLPTLMHDPVYRSGVASEQSAYNQPPHIGFYLADEIYKPQVSELEITSMPNKTTYAIGDSFDADGLEVTAHFNTGESEVVTGYVITGFDSSRAGTQTITVTYGKKSAAFEVTVDSGFTIDENGLVTRYTSNLTDAVLPETIDGISVTGFADNALSDSPLTYITVTSQTLTFGDNVFPGGITIRCYEGSDAHIYAVKNDIAYELIDTTSYLENITYSESEYSGLSMKQQTTGSQTKQIGHITYGVGARDKGGDNDTGFLKTTYSDEDVLQVRAGRFASSGRHAYMTFSDLPTPSNSSDSVFETDILIGSDTSASLNIFDDAAASVSNKQFTATPVDTISVSDVETDTWYTYKIVYHMGTYYRSLVKKGETEEYTQLSASPSDSGICKVIFESASGEQGTWYLDNTKLYTGTVFAELTLNIVNPAGDPISGAAVTIGDTAYTADADGTVSTRLTAGLYNVTVSADGYTDTDTIIGAYETTTEKTVTVSKSEIPVTGVAFEKDTLSLKVGGTDAAKASVVPANASNTLLTYTSSDESVATVDENGNVTGISTGTAAITAASSENPELTAICTVTVYADYESTVTSIEITGADTVYIPTYGHTVTEEYTAQAYDQNGAKCGADFTWTCEGLSMDGGVLSVDGTAAEGEYTVSAASGDVVGTFTVTLKSLTADTDTIAKVSGIDDGWYMTQQSDSAQSTTFGNITYNVGNRTGGGDNQTGFAYSGGILSMYAGRFGNNSGRMAYMNFDNAPTSYDTAKDYVIDADIYYHPSESGDPASLHFMDSDGNDIIQLNSISMGLESETWYHISLVYSDGQYTLYVTDSDGKITLTDTISASSSNPIARLGLTGSPSNTDPFAYKFASFEYYSTDNAFKTIYVKVLDNTDAAVSSAEVAIGTVTAVTGANGKAKFKLPAGVYTAEAEGYGSVEIPAATTGETFTIGGATPTPTETPTTAPTETPTTTPTTAPTETPTTTPTPTETPTMIPVSEYGIDDVTGTTVTYHAATAVIIYTAVYGENGILTSVDKFTVNAGNGTVTAKQSPDKIFMWSGDNKMTPLTAVWEK